MPSIRRLLTCSILFIGAGLMSACGGGGGDSGPTATKNFSASDVTVTTSKPEIGYPLDVTVDFTSNEEANNVSVSLFAVEKTDTPDAVPQQYPLGSQSLDKVVVGNNEVQMHVSLPSNITKSGQYYLTAVVNPAGEIAETDRDDNTASVEVTLDNSPGPNVKLLKLELDRSAMLINTSTYAQQVNAADGDVYNSDAAGTITVGADGLAADATIDIDSYAKLRIHRTDNNTTYDLPVYLWKSSADRYTYAYGVDPTNSTSTDVEWLPLGTFNPKLAGTDLNNATVDDTDRDSARMEFYLPGRLGSVLVIAARHYPVALSSGPTVPPPDLTANVIDALTSFLSGLPASTDPNDPYDETAAMAVLQFSFCVDIRPSDSSIIDQDASDNEVCSPIAVSLPPRSIGGTPTTLPPSLTGFTPVLGSSAFRVTPVPNSIGNPTKGGGKMFSFAVDFGSTTTADNHGYVEEDHGYVPINILNGFLKFDFVKIDIRAQLIPDSYDGKPAGENSEFTIEVRHVGQLLTSVNKIPSNIEISLGRDIYSKEYPSEEDRKTKHLGEATTLVGPIPLSVGYSVSGGIGFEYQPLVFTAEDPDYKLGLSGGPVASLEGRAYAGVGGESLGFIAGIEGILSLLKEQVEFFNGVTVTMHQASYPSEFTIEQGPKITNIFTGPQGFINLFVKYSIPTIKKCKVGPVKIPCPGFKTIKATKNLYKTKALFQKTDILYQKKSLNLDVVIPQDADPIYYTTTP